MSVDQRQLLAYLSNDADFRAWGSGLAAQLAAMGLVKTTDTGQIDWATVLRPGVSTYAGYEIWRFNDALQATKPVFIKMEYGGSATVDRPNLRVTVGTGTNGAGTLTGQVGTTRVLAPTASKTAGTSLPSYSSGSTSRLNLATNLDSASAQFTMGLFIERTKSVDGANTGDGIVTFGISGNTNGNYQVIPFSGSIPVVATANMALGFDGVVSSAGAGVALNPTIASVGKALFASWLVYKHADIGELTPFTITHLGGVRTYMPLGDGFYGYYAAWPNATTNALAMLWE